jgi:hypothetical protein
MSILLVVPTSYQPVEHPALLLISTLTPEVPADRLTLAWDRQY